jgi:rhamnosyltransferase
MRTPEVSIIIRTLNEARYLLRLLEAIDAQRCELRSEVVLIDSGSTDGTLEIARDQGCRVLSITREEFSFGRSLNRGCAAAAGSWLVIISGHCVPCHGSWLQRLIDPLLRGDADYSYGRQLGGPSTQWSEKRVFEKYYPPVSRIPQQGFFCNNANSSLSHAQWKRYGFDETLTGLEDMHLARRLVADGGKVAYVAEASVFHYHHEGWAQIRRRYEREALALQNICPEVVIRRRDLARYLLTSITHDSIEAFKDRQRLPPLKQILYYRLAQYIGSYIGNHNHRRLTQQMRESYFFPTPSSQTALSPEPSPFSPPSQVMPTEASRTILALLPMKAHSARVSGKNFRDFCGKPLFRWVLDTLLEVNEIDRVIINTDARELLKQHGLTDTDRILVRDRPESICGDFVSMNRIIEDDLRHTEADVYLMTHTTNPLLSAATIRKALHTYNTMVSNGAADSLFSVDRIQTRFYRRDGSPVNHDPDNLVRTQDLEPWYEENSNLYLFTKESFAATQARIGRKPHLFVTPKYESIDIDEPEDWNFAVATQSALMLLQSTGVR